MSLAWTNGTGYAKLRYLQKVPAKGCLYMNKRLLIPLTAAVGGAAAFVLRWLQNARGFEPETGLPIPGHPAGIALAVLLAALAIVLFFLARRLPAGAVYPEDFAASDASMLMLPVMGALVFAASGVLELAPLAVPELIPDGRSLSPVIRLFFAASSLIPAAVLFQAASVCRHALEKDPEDEEATEPADDTAHICLLAIPVCLIVRLVLTYRVCSVSPSLEEYYVHLLALVLTVMAFYRLCSCAFRAGDTRRFALYSAVAVVLSIAALADRGTLSQALFHAGTVLSLMGFLLLRLCCRHSAEN